MIECLECGNDKLKRINWRHLQSKCTGRFKNANEYLKEYPNAKIVDDEVVKKTTLTLENFVLKYGFDDGNIRWNQYKEKQAYSNTYEYKNKKHGWTKEKYDEFNKSRAVTIENLIKKHGEEVGTKMWIEYCERQAYTNTIDYFIEKYGDEEGTKRYKTMVIQKSVPKSSNENSRSSKAEMEFIYDLEQTLNETIEFSTYSKQYMIFEDTKLFFYDVVHKKRAIEFNGDYWHCNPEIYSENYYHEIIQQTAKDIWERDAIKVDAIEKHGIPCLVIWEKDYTINKKETIEKCKKWILHGVK